MGVRQRRADPLQWRELVEAGYQQQAPFKRAEVLTIIGSTQPWACSNHCRAVAATLKAAHSSR